MSDNLRVPPELEGAGGKMAGHAATIEGYLNTLKGKLDPLKDYWQGPAQQYYQDLQAEWNAAAEGLLGPTGVCGDISSALNLAWNNYTDCEWANVKTWTSAGNR
jgi:WXG100 family type VII secretion target